MPTLTTPNGKAGTLRHTEKLTEDGVRREASQVYVVKADSASDNAATIMATSGVPQFGTVFTGDTRLGVRQRTPRRIGNSLLWEITINWSSNTKKREEEQEEDQPPTERPPVISGDAEVIRLPFVRDSIFTETKPLVASNKQPFLNTPSRDVYVDVLTYTRYEDTFPQAKKVTFQGKVNLSDVTVGGVTYGQKQALISRISYDNGSEVDGEWVWRVTYVFKFHPEAVDGSGNGGWMRAFLDQGYFYTDANDNIQHFADDTDSPTTGNLDGDGGKLDADEDPVFLWFNEFEAVDFTQLNLT